MKKTLKQMIEQAIKDRSAPLQFSISRDGDLSITIGRIVIDSFSTAWCYPSGTFQISWIKDEPFQAFRGEYAITLLTLH